MPPEPDWLTRCDRVILELLGRLDGGRMAVCEDCLTNHIGPEGDSVTQALNRLETHDCITRQESEIRLSERGQKMVDSGFDRLVAC